MYHFSIRKIIYQVKSGNLITSRSLIAAETRRSVSFSFLFENKVSSEKIFRLNENGVAGSKERDD